MPHKNLTKKIAIHLHLYYVDLLDELIVYLKNIRAPFDLYITITDADSKAHVLKTCKKTLGFDVFVLLVENKGRDVKPFYTDLKENILQYEFVCHIHGKKSLFNNGATKGWLDHLLSNLLGSEEIIDDILYKLSESKIGLIYPPTYPGLPYWAHNWLSNTGQAYRLQSKLDIGSLPKGYFSYPVGNMFWARVDAIRPLLNLNLTTDDYPAENKQTDGEIMHALERLVAVVSANRGFNNLIVKEVNGSATFTLADEAIDYSGYDNNSLENLKQAIDRNHIKVVSFDIFDTLICRPLLEPDDMFDLMEEKVSNIIGKKINFKEIRKQADASARATLQEAMDVNIDNIYTEVKQVLGISSATAEKLKRLELAYEIQMLTARSAVVEVLNYAHASGKRCILTSDMYLQESHLKTILDNLGIVSYHKIYISADVGHRKDRRTLFPHVLKNECVDPNELLHIGDNEHSDLQIPGDLGITVFHVKRGKDLFLRSHLGKHVYKHRFHNIPVYYKGCLALAINKFYDNPFPRSQSLVKSDLELFGYYYFGPILLSYVKWVADTARSYDIKKLYFISRDGEILYKIYRLLKASDDTIPDADYIEISRRSLVIPFISSKGDIDKALNANYFGDTLKNYFIARLGVDISYLTKKKLRKYGFESVDTPVNIPADLEKIKPLAYAVHKDNKDALVKEKGKAISYLKEKGLFDKSKKSIVDIGYSGTMQRQLNTITRMPIHGLYMVTYDTIKTQIDGSKVITKGLFGDNINPFSEEPLINKYSLFYEMILSSRNGPVEKYVGKKKKISPVYEKVAVEEKVKLEKLPLIHKGILDFCNDFQFRFDGFHLVDYADTRILQEAFWHFIEHPQKEDIMMLAGYTLDDHYCGNGVFYWVPDKESIKNKSFDKRKCLWQKAIEELYPEEPLRPGIAVTKRINGFPNQNGKFETPQDKEIFDWYSREYEVLPDWYKKIGHVVKLIKGNKKLKIILEDSSAPAKEYTSKAEEIQAWYNKEYEVTPGWYKKFGHVLKIMSGNRKIKDYL